VNAVSLYVEHGRETFHSVHVEAAQRLAVHARRARVERLAHVSGIGSDAGSPSPYIRNVAKASWRFGPRSQTPFSFARR
jgi:uncharacterized protein YbjT (DUF2867 family)